MSEPKVKPVTEWIDMSGSRQVGRFVARLSRTSCVVVEAVGRLPARALQDEAVEVLLHDAGSYVLVLFSRELVSRVMFAGSKAAELAERLGEKLRARGAAVTIKPQRRVDPHVWAPAVLGTTLSVNGRFGVFVTATRMAGLRARLAMRGNRFVFAKAELALATGQEPDPLRRRRPRAVWRVRYVAVEGYVGGHVVVRAFDKSEALAIVGCEVADVAVARTRQPIERSEGRIISRDLQAVATPRQRSTADGRYPRRYENLKAPPRDPVIPGRRSGRFGQHRRRQN